MSLKRFKNIKKLSFLILFFIFTLAFLGTERAYASHGMAADLTYKCLGGNLYEFTLTFYRDCSGVSAPTNASVDISSASCGFSTTISLPPTPPVEVSALCQTELPNSTCKGGNQPGVEQYVYTDTFTLPAECPDWEFSFNLCCRNPLTTTLVSPSSEDMWVEATLNNTGGLCNSSPYFTSLPVPYICAHDLYGYNHGAVDADGDSLVYTMINPLGDFGNPIGYVGSFSPTHPLATETDTVFFDSITGQMAFTPLLEANSSPPPDSIQVAVIAVLVEEYRNGVLIGTTMRDMQIIVMECGTVAPYYANEGILNFQGGPGSFLIDSTYAEVCAGESISFEVVGEDSNAVDITMTTNLADAIPGMNFYTVGTNPITGYFSWTPTPADFGLRTFTVTITDDICPVMGNKIYTFSINVNLGTYAGIDVYLCEDDSMQLNASGGTAFTWSPTTWLSDPNIANPIAYPPVTTTYTVTSDLVSTCQNVDSVTV